MAKFKKVIKKQVSKPVEKPKDIYKEMREEAQIARKEIRRKQHLIPKKKSY